MPHSPTTSNSLFVQPQIETQRFILEPATEQHAEELYFFFSDPELHHVVPFEPPTLEQQRKKCRQWAKRCSPDKKEWWLNWVARDKDTKKVAAHIQSVIKKEENQIASIGYVVAKKFQKQGIATECLLAIFDYLQFSLQIKEIKACTNSQNEPSHRLCKKLGMTHIETIKNSSFFKGQSQDEFVFSKKLSP